MNIADNLKRIHSSIPQEVCLVAVSKTKPNEAIMEAYQAGHKDFGENKIQDLVAKQEVLPQDINWHFIGHLQTNKVKYIAPFVHLIHAVDSLKLAKEINKRAVQNDRIIPILLQNKIASEDSKFGLSKEDLIELIHSDEFKALTNIKVAGLMGMATNTEDTQQVKSEFEQLKSLFEMLQSASDSLPNVEMKTLSMGMSGDYPIAIEAGSNMIRVGSSIFGARNYH